MRICVIMNTILPGDIWMAVLAFAMTRSQRIMILSMALYKEFQKYFLIIIYTSIIKLKYN